MLTTRGLAHLSGYDNATCSNFLHDRIKYVAEIKRETLYDVSRMSHAQIVLVHLQKSPTLTMAQALTWYGIGALSQRVGDLNRKFERANSPLRVVNTAGKGPGVHAIYTLQKYEAAK